MAPICEKCKNKLCLKDGKPCDKVEKLLPKPSTGRLKGEHSFDPHILEEMASNQAYKLKFGHKKAANHLEDD